ncbi:hypothetical protein [Actinomyces sp. ICM47]|jgi:hypothetical protein|uniref:hypothetical protein n=1 Tax=Actinomyces sp. ICM47 TaxID=936548 RepID=UPI00027337FD|nr:hypothetical protein [Actinomyces sp. ICM47]EJG14904.1 hypothetical protein HMPREF1136_0547 [Actinomyces sp. ICM47]
MVPADDERTSANEPEDNTSRQKNFLEKLKFWKRCKQEDDEPARLTAMPPCLMKWWTPLLIAFVLFVLSFISALGWGWQWHWPSSNAMKLCMTITGAGFAFSAWQQRNSDNATRELERATETLWHMRNTAHELLSANSYYDQYEGICRYFELADQLNKSIQKESNTTRILNSAILSALCAHIRYLGDPLPNNFENENERGELQNLILNNILERINTNLKGYWDGMSINLTDTIFLTPISITNFTSSSMIHFNHSTFNHKVNLEIFQKATLLWKYATFHSQLTVTGQPKGTNNEKPVLHQDNFPSEVKLWHFENIALCILEDLQHQIAPGGPLPNQDFPLFKECNFLRPKATQQHPTDVSADADTDFFDEPETPTPPDNYIWATISFNFDLLDENVDTTLYFKKCIFGRLSTSNTSHLSKTYFTQCKITQDNETDANNIAPEHFKFTDCEYFGPSDR